jgi:hypothetical protein
MLRIRKRGFAAALTISAALTLGALAGAAPANAVGAAIAAVGPAVGPATGPAVPTAAIAALSARFVTKSTLGATALPTISGTSSSAGLVTQSTVVASALPSISGTVTGVSGTGLVPLGDIVVFAEGAGFSFFSADTDASGHYVLDGLDAGTYLISFMDFSDARPHFAGFEKRITVGATGVTVLNKTLQPGSTVGGTLTTPGGALDGLAGAFALNGDEWDLAAFAFTDASGRYVLDGLAAGTYTVAFIDGTGNFAPEYYDNVANFASATRVEVGAAAAVPGIDAMLDPYSDLPYLVADDPTTTGRHAVGSTLTAQNGTWASGVTFTYQWMRNDSPIEGATGATYTLVPADQGAEVNVMVTGSQEGSNSADAMSSNLTVVAKGTLTRVPPTISGVVKVGSTLTATAGTWGPAPVTLKYKWYRSGVAITGATAATYTLVPADARQTMVVKVTGSKTGYATATSASVATVAVALGSLSSTTPTITGTKKSGYTLTANPGVWGPGTVTLKYQWYRSGVAISGATGKTYKLVSADRYDTIKLRVIGSKGGYATVTKYSVSTVTIP